MDGLSEHDFEALLISNDKRCIGVLLEMPDNLSTQKISRQRKTLLKRLLPLLTPEDAPLFTPEQMECLVPLLITAPRELTLEILEALGEIGDKFQLSSLELLKFTHFSKLRKPEIQQAYQSCIKAMKARLASNLSP